MDTLTINTLIKEAPVAIALLDDQYCFQTYSSVWEDKFSVPNSNLLGINLFEVMPYLKSELETVLPKCLRGESHQNDAKKLVVEGIVKWLKWKVKPQRNLDGIITGIILFLEDISENKRKEEIHQKAVEVAKIGGWEIDLLTNDLYWTDITKQIHELPLDYMPKLEEGIKFYKEGRHRDTISKVVARAMADGTPWDVNLVIVTAKGRERWVRAMGSVEMKHGKCVRIFGTFQDIDDEKRMEIKLNEVSNRLAIATTGSNIGIWEYSMLNEDFVWDDNMYKLYGVKRINFNPNNRHHWRRAVHPDDLDTIVSTHNNALEGKKEYETQYRIVTPKGEIRHLGARAVIIYDEKGTPTKMIGTNFDITELSKTQLMLERSEESLHRAFEKSTTGMALVGLKGEWIQVNKQLCSKLGYTEEELRNKNFQDITHPEDLEKDVALLNEVIKGKRDSYKIEKRYLNKEGKTIFAILTVTAVRNIEGRLSHFISQVMDISQRIKAEEELTRLLNITKQQNDSLLNFAHIVSHNLRSHATNLSMLTGFLEGEKDESEVTEIHSMLKDASESLNETVVHLNDVVQLKVGANEKMVPVNLPETLHTVKKNLSVLLNDKKVQCTVDMPHNLTVNGIPAYIDSIFLNLITNSIKYSSPKRTPTLNITTEITENHVILSFADNGLGINLKRHGKKIFGMYKTFHKNKDAKGIGLFITKNQMESMRGKIEVESEVGIGTTFKLYFENNQTPE
ncbi:PAS domain-containing sensor histidine kinase [Euzebyella saccharophila]|uniref:histidine kinase n=1 Tax=Euzebyella saccharophila TaxID=679664 RepID=A0ABV8JS07_9FLAO|nr:PAS domain S-box protein [Euzebyella saccharophila]